MKANIPRNPRIPQYSDDKYEHEDLMTLESNELPDLPHVPDKVPGMSEDESVRTLSQSSVETIDSKGFNSGDRKLLDVLVSMADCCSQESAMSGVVSRHFNITIIEEECTGPTTPSFFPLSLYYRKQIAEKFNISDAVGRMSFEGIPGITCMKKLHSKTCCG